MHKKTMLLLGMVLLLVAGTITYVTAMSHQTASNMSCEIQGKTHSVLIRNSKLTPTHVEGQRCDRLKITNLDNISREIGFGEHDHHIPYDGTSEKLLHEGDSLTVTMNQTGTFGFHDHFHDEVAGTFTVK